MVILNIETSTRVCSAALTIGGVPVATRIGQAGESHAVLLPRFVDELLSELKQKNLSLEAVALAEGPGSYTGLRIGASTAKGICYAMRIPLIPIPTTEVLVACMVAQHSVPNDAVLCPMIDARRMEVYTALYDTNIRPLCPIEAKVITTDTQLTDDKNRPVYFFGDGAAKCRDILENEQTHFVDGIELNAQYMGVLAEQTERYPQVPDLAYYEPFYLKEFIAAPSHVKGLE